MKLWMLAILNFDGLVMGHHKLNPGRCCSGDLPVKVDGTTFETWFRRAL